MWVAVPRTGRGPVRLARVADAKTSQVSEIIDFDLARTGATRLLRPGPNVSAWEAADVVARLYAHAESSVAQVSEVTGLVCPTPSVVRVVDRPTWVGHNVDSMAHLLGPGLVQGMSKRPEPVAVARGLSRRIAGAELGSVLAYMSSRVLGQFDPYLRPATPEGAEPLLPGSGHLLLVAPNVISVERKLGVDPESFRLWVCLHEETHRQQFGCAPWLAEYLNARITSMIADTLGEAGEVFARLGQGLRRLPEALSAEGTGLMGVLQTDEQKKVLGELTAVMSLLEGHADVVMDAAGEAVIADVVGLRRAMTDYRTQTSSLHTMVRRLLGVEAKMKQYETGAVFVRAVVAEAGWPGLNRVWAEPGNLPTAEEIADPAAWVRRVAG